MTADQLKRRNEAIRAAWDDPLRRALMSQGQNQREAAVAPPVRLTIDIIASTEKGRRLKGWGITTFPSHSDVFCLRCSEALGKEAPFAADPSLGVGSFRKRCPRCQLVTSYDVSPAEAAAVELEEPDWKERFEAHIARWPKLPRYLAENEAFEQTLKEWRRFHAVDNKPAIAYEGMVALARLKILPPRSLIKDIERTGACFQRPAR